MYTLIGGAKNRSFRVLWMLEELQQKYELLADGPRSPLALQHNPSGRVPVLLTQGQALSDSVAIIQYLADKHEQCTMTTGSLARAQQDSLTQFAMSEMDAILWNVALHSFVLPKELRSDQVRAACEWDFARSMETLQTRFGDGPYLMGNTFTVADILVTHCAGWASNVGFNLPGGKIESYLVTVRARPAFMKAAALRDKD